MPSYQLLLLSSYNRLTPYEKRICKVFEKAHKDHMVIYDFTECGIGTGVNISCLECKVKEDATDYESW